MPGSNCQEELSHTFVMIRYELGINTKPYTVIHTDISRDRLRSPAALDTSIQSIIKHSGIKHLSSGLLAVTGPGLSNFRSHQGPSFLLV